MGACFYCAFRINGLPTEVPGEQMYVLVLSEEAQPWKTYSGWQYQRTIWSINEKESRILWL